MSRIISPGWKTGNAQPAGIRNGSDEFILSSPATLIGFSGPFLTSVVNKHEITIDEITIVNYDLLASQLLQLRTSDLD